MTPGILGLSHISLSVRIVTRPNASDATPAAAAPPESGVARRLGRECSRQLGTRP
jgi:hypothetical protein